MKKGRWSLQSVIIIFVCVVVTLSLLITDVLISSRVASGTKESQAEKARNVARMVAHSPIVNTCFYFMGVRYKIKLIENFRNNGGGHWF